MHGNVKSPLLSSRPRVFVLLPVGLILAGLVLSGCSASTQEAVDEAPAANATGDAKANLASATDAQPTSGLFPFAGPWVPAGTIRADGGVLPISEGNAVLYTLMGARFGGNNTTTFAAPTAKDIPTLPSQGESNPPPIKWLMSMKGTFPLNQLPTPMAPGEMTFLGSNRPLVVDGVTAEPALARRVAPKINAWNNSQKGSADQYDRFVGQLSLFSGAGKIPPSYLPLDGRLLPIDRNQVLFTVLGSSYGGDGRTSFALPKVADWGTAKWATCVDGTFPSRS